MKMKHFIAIYALTSALYPTVLKILNAVIFAKENAISFDIGIENFNIDYSTRVCRLHLTLRIYRDPVYFGTLEFLVCGNNARSSKP